MGDSLRTTSDSCALSYRMEPSLNGPSTLLAAKCEGIESRGGSVGSTAGQNLRLKSISFSIAGSIPPTVHFLDFRSLFRAAYIFRHVRRPMRRDRCHL